MLNLRTKFKKIILFLILVFSFLLVFLYDTINWRVNIDSIVLLSFRHVLVVIGFVVIYLIITSLWKESPTPIKRIGFLLISLLTVTCTIVFLLLITSLEFETKNHELLPLNFYSIILSNIYSIVLGVTSIIVLFVIRDIIFIKRRKETSRNFYMYIIAVLTTAFSTMLYKPLDAGWVVTLFFIISVITIFLNSFRLSWIIYLSKREKLFTMIYGFLIFAFSVAYNILLSPNMPIGKALLYYSPPLKAFVYANSIFAIVYFGLTFVSTLFHLPTAEAIDRKITEISSIHNLSRLINQVFDFHELANTVTKMSMEVCSAKCAWLEIININSDSKVVDYNLRDNNPPIEVIKASLKNITMDEVDEIVSANDSLLRKLVIEERRPIIIDNVRTDRRINYTDRMKSKFNSMLIVPMLSHDRVIGVLYVLKEVEYGFDKDDIDVISTFADQAAIAIENSRLIEKSLERERLMREMMVAHEIQKKLLPQQLPSFEGLEVEALSTPAFEVGGDYYDFTMLDNENLAILVGDVSGKGVSAAFYMAEMKGIFQSLSKMYKSPKAFLTKAHDALVGTIDKKTFISVIYAILNLKSGVLTVARAGHCPMLFISEGIAKYVKQTGIGLGISATDFFEKVISEVQITLRRGDVVLFYTDGLTEAQRRDGEEFGYERLLEVVSSGSKKNVMEIRDAIITAVDKHMNHEPPADDLTLVILKWNKN